MEAALFSPLGKMTLGPNMVTIGNTPDNQLIVNDAKASSHHALVRAEAQGYSITDWDSANGTYVNEQRLTPKVPRLLNPGDTIRIGDSRFIYQVSGAPQPQMASNPVGAPFVVPDPSVAAGPQVNAPSDKYQAVPPGNAPAAYPQQQQYPRPQPQSAQPQQPFMPAPGQVQGQASFPNNALARPVRKRGLPVVVLAVVGALLVLALLGFFLLRAVRSTNSSGGGTSSVPTASTNVSGPTKTLQAYCNALKKGDYKAAYNQYSTRFRSHITEQSFAQTASALFAAAGGLKDCTVSNVHANGSTATGTITLTTGSGKTTMSNVQLVDEKGTWKIDSPVQ